MPGQEREKDKDKERERSSSSKSKDKEAAWKFIEYANSARGQEIVARTGRTVPLCKFVWVPPAQSIL
mgnify:CR=1 FL=1